MKYNINNNSIDIEYIANGKRNQLKLNNDDHIDMDFFNQLLKAKSNKRDAMCDLFKRKILMEDDKDTIHIQPLKLDKELKPSKYAEKVELQRRKAELEQDKQHIAEEAKVLLKEEAKKKEITTLTKDDLTNENDLNKLKEIQARYIEIDKVHKMIINQLDSLEIGTADQVNIKELKNLTVNAFDNINKKLIETKLSEKDKQELQNKIAPILVPDFKPLQDSIDDLLKQLNILPKKTSDKREVVSKDYAAELQEIKAALSTIINSLPKTETVNELKDTLKNINTISQNTSNMAKQLATLNTLLYQLPDVIQKELEKQFSSINFSDYTKAINQLSQKIANLEDKSSAEKKVESKDYTDKFSEITNKFEELKTNILTAINNLPNSENVQKLQDELSKVKFNTDNIPDMKKQLEELKTALKDLPGVFKKETIDKVTKTTNDLIQVSDSEPDKLNTFLSQKITNDLIKNIKKLPEINPKLLDGKHKSEAYIEFKAKLFADVKNQDTKTGYIGYKHSTLKELPDIAFIWENSLYYKSDETFDIPFTYELYGGLNFQKYSFEDIQNSTVKDWLKHLSMWDLNSITLSEYPKLYADIRIGIQKHEQSNQPIWYPMIHVGVGTSSLIEFIKALTQDEVESSSESSEGILNKYSGKINIDLNQSSANEKLNEIIRLLSQLNYNVFTTTPMYKQSIQSKKKAKAQGFQNDSEENESESVDLYDFLDL
jgi:hypothetical protein